MNLCRLPRSTPVFNGVLKPETRQSTVHFGRPDAADTHIRALARALCVVPRPHLVRRKPWLKNDDPVSRQMVPKAAQRLCHSVQCLHISDGTKETEDDVVASGKMKIAHVGFEELPGGVLRSRNSEELWIEVETVDRETMSLSQEASVFARPARDVQYSPVDGID